MTTKRAKVDAPERSQILFRTSSEDEARLDKLVKRLPLKKAALAREAMRLGLTQLEADPAAIVAPVQSH